MLGHLHLVIEDVISGFLQGQRLQELFDLLIMVSVKGFSWEYVHLIDFCLKVELQNYKGRESSDVELADYAFSKVIDIAHLIMNVEVRQSGGSSGCPAVPLRGELLPTEL